MEVKEQTKLTFHGVDIVGIQFASENPMRNDAEIELKIIPKVFYPKQNPLEFKVVFETIVKSEAVFSLTLHAIGHFSIGENLEDSVKRGFVNTNAPAIMFPYIRSFISTLTSNMGNATTAIVLPPHFFSGQLEEMQITEESK